MSNVKNPEFEAKINRGRDGKFADKTKPNAPATSTNVSDPYEEPEQSDWTMPTMPKLTGTERQVAWANTIRDDVINGLNIGITNASTPIERDTYQSAAVEATKHTEAKYWIEGRNSNLAGNLIRDHLNSSVDGHRAEGRVIRHDRAVRLDFDSNSGKIRVDYTRRRPEEMRLSSEPEYDYRSRPVFYTDQSKAVKEAAEWLDGGTPKKLAEEYD